MISWQKISIFLIKKTEYHSRAFFKAQAARVPGLLSTVHFAYPVRDGLAEFTRVVD